jgi:hypothetical protein
MEELGLKAVEEVEPVLAVPAAASEVPVHIQS